MSSIEVVLSVLTSAVVTGAGYATSWLVGIELRRSQFTVGAMIFLQAGVIYTVFLAFIFGHVLTRYVDTSKAVHRECAALYGASIIATALPAQQRSQVRDALKSYIAAVIDPEWPAMREMRRSSPAAMGAQIALLERANTLDVALTKDIASKSRLVDLLLEAQQYREERILRAGQEIPAGLWAMVLASCGVIVGLFFSSLNNASSHPTMSAIFGAFNAIVLLACFLLQFPFEGSFRLAPTSFVVTQACVEAMLAP